MLGSHVGKRAAEAGAFFGDSAFGHTKRGKVCRDYFCDGERGFFLPQSDDRFIGVAKTRSYGPLPCVSLPSTRIIRFMSKQESAIVAAGFLALFGIIFYTTQCGTNGCNTGVGHLPTNFAECVAAGYRVRQTMPRQCQSPDGTLFTEDAQGTTGKPKKPVVDVVKVTEPVAKASIGVPVSIKGTANVFEDQVNYRVVDIDGTVLAEGHVKTESGALDVFKAFQIKASYTEPYGDHGTVDVFERTADGQEDGLVSVPVSFTKVDRIPVQLFFMNAKKDPQRLHCDVTYAVTHKIPPTDSPEKSALLALLDGTLAVDKKNGYETAVPVSALLKDFQLDKGTATVDFSKELSDQVAGSCRTAAVRSQITQTLLQFPTVKKVVITVEGSSKGVLGK